MKKLALTLTTLAALVAGTLFAFPGAARADDLSNINVTYRGGALIENVKVATLFWGQPWDGGSGPDDVNSFFYALFDDGRFMANLSQYSAGGYQIGSGELVASVIDPAALPGTVTDAQIREEIRAQIDAGNLPQPDADMLYVVCTPPDVVVEKGNENSVKNFAGYHGYDVYSGFAYAVIASTKDMGSLTSTASHELAEAVTDAQVNAGTLGWYDDNNGEIGDIPQKLFFANLIGEESLYDTLTGGDGMQYRVQQIWSIQDGMPIAFAQE